MHDWRREVRGRLTGLRLSPAREADIVDEISQHLAERYAELTSGGTSPEEAAQLALADFRSDNVLAHRIAALRQAHAPETVAAGAATGRLVTDFWQDLRYAARTLAKARGFTAVVVATLALGIGGIAAVFSVIHAVLLEPLPYEAPGALVRIYQQEPSGDVATRHFVSAAYFREIRDVPAAFEDVAALSNYSEAGVDLVRDGRAEHLRVLPVSSGYFETLRAGALRGRSFERSEENRAKLVVLSDDLWHARFGADEDVIGSTIELSAESYVVIGIAPPGLADPIAGKIDAWLPAGIVGDTYVENYSLSILARLRNGVTLAQARAELDSLSSALAERWPDVDRSAIVAEPLHDDLVAGARATLNALTAAVALVLLVACVNVANLLLVRATGRVRELAIRAALGCGAARIARQLLAESLLLAGLGAAAGLVLAALALRVLRTLGGNAIPQIGEIGLNPAVLGVTIAVSLCAAVAFGTAPALRLARVQPADALRRQSRSTTAGRAPARARTGLAAAQLALALTLLVSAASLLASFYRLQHIDLGFRSTGVLTFDLGLPAARYDAERRAAFQEELARRIGALPGVTAAGGTSRLPATGPYHPWGALALTGPLAGETHYLSAQQRVVSGELFAALEIPRLAGRLFDDRDDTAAPPRAVVSASFAERGFPGMPLETVVGQRIRVIGRDLEVIGVVADVKLDAHGAEAPAVYQAHRQFAGNRNWALTGVVASTVPPETLLAAVRAEVASLDSTLVIHRAAPLTEVVGRGVARERFALVLIGAFAGVALLLSVIGLYGVLAYIARERQQEIGIRMVLGASAASVSKLVLGQATRIVVLGVTLGAAGVAASGRLLESLLYGTSTLEPLVLAAAVVLLTGAALLAAYLPARRAARVDPLIAMQDE